MVRCRKVPPRGLETLPVSPDSHTGLRHSPAVGAAESGAVSPELLAAALLNLSPADRARLAAMLLGQAEGERGTP